MIKVLFNSISRPDLISLICGCYTMGMFANFFQKTMDITISVLPQYWFKGNKGKCFTWNIH